MTRFFVLTYDRSAGKLLESQEFEQGDAAQAQRMRLDLQHRRNREVEVVVLEAESLADIQTTHSRYFKTFGEIARG